MAAPQDTENLLTVENLAERFHVNPGTIYRWRSQGKFPRGVRIGENTLRWTEAEIAAWLEAKQAAAS